MKKRSTTSPAFALTVLTVMLVPIISWAAIKIIDNSERVAKIEVKEKNLKENILEIKSDVKYIRQKLEK